MHLLVRYGVALMASSVTNVPYLHYSMASCSAMQAMHYYYLRTLA